MERITDQVTGWRFNREDALCSFYSRDGATRFQWDSSPPCSWSHFAPPWIHFEQGPTNVLEGRNIIMSTPYDQDCYYEILARSGRPPWQDGILSTYIQALNAYERETTDEGGSRNIRLCEAESDSHVLAINSFTPLPQNTHQVKFCQRNAEKVYDQNVKETSKTDKRTAESRETSCEMVAADVLPSEIHTLPSNWEKKCHEDKSSDQEKERYNALPTPDGNCVNVLVGDEQSERTCMIFQNVPTYPSLKNDVILNLALHNAYTAGDLHNSFHTAGNKIHGVFERNKSYTSSSSNRCPHYKGTHSEEASDMDHNSSLKTSATKAACTHVSSNYSEEFSGKRRVKQSNMGVSESISSRSSTPSQTDDIVSSQDSSTSCEVDCTGRCVEHRLHHQNGQYLCFPDYQMLEKDKHTTRDRDNSNMLWKNGNRCEPVQRQIYGSSDYYPIKNKETHRSHRRQLRTTQSELKSFSREEKTEMHRTKESAIPPHTNDNKNFRNGDVKQSKDFVWEMLPFECKLSNTIASCLKYTEFSTHHHHYRRHLTHRTDECENSIKHKTMGDDAINSTPKMQRKKHRSFHDNKEKSTREEMHKTEIVGEHDRKELLRSDVLSSEIAKREKKSRNSAATVLRSAINRSDQESSLCDTTLGSSQADYESRHRESSGKCHSLLSNPKRTFSSAPTSEKDCSSAHYSSNICRNKSTHHAMERKTVGDSVQNVTSDSNQMNTSPYFALLRRFEEINRGIREELSTTDTKNINTSWKKEREILSSHKHKSCENSCVKTETEKRLENVAVQTMELQSIILPPNIPLENCMCEILSHIIKEQWRGSLNTQDNEIGVSESSSSESVHSNRLNTNPSSANTDKNISSKEFPGEADAADLMPPSYTEEKISTCPIPCNKMASVCNGCFSSLSSLLREAYVEKSSSIYTTANQTKELENLSDTTLKQCNKNNCSDKSGSDSLLEKGENQNGNVEMTVQDEKSLNHQEEISPENKNQDFTPRSASDKDKMSTSPTPQTKRRTKYVEISRRVLQNSDGKLVEEIVLAQTSSRQKEVPEKSLADAAEFARPGEIKETHNIRKSRSDNCPNERGLEHTPNSCVDAETLLHSSASSSVRGENSKRKLKRTPPVFELMNDPRWSDTNDKKQKHTFRRLLSRVTSRTRNSPTIVLRTPVKSGSKSAGLKEPQNSDDFVRNYTERDLVSESNIQSVHSLHTRNIEGKPPLDNTDSKVPLCGTNVEDDLVCPTSCLYDKKTTEPVMIMTIVQSASLKQERNRDILPTSIADASNLTGNMEDRARLLDNHLYREISKHSINCHSDHSLPSEETSVLPSVHGIRNEKRSVHLHGNRPTVKTVEAESFDTRMERFRSCSQVSKTQTLQEFPKSLQGRTDHYSNNQEVRVDADFRNNTLLKKRRKSNVDVTPSKGRSISDTSETSACSLPTIKEEVHRSKRLAEKKRDVKERRKSVKNMAEWRNNMNVALDLLQKLINHNLQIAQSSATSGSSQRTCTSAESTLNSRSKHARTEHPSLNERDVRDMKSRKRSKSYDRNIKNVDFSDENLKKLFKYFQKISTKSHSLNTNNSTESDHYTSSPRARSPDPHLDDTQDIVDYFNSDKSNNLNGNGTRDKIVSDGCNDCDEIDGEYSSASDENSNHKVQPTWIYNPLNGTLIPLVHTCKRYCNNKRYDIAKQCITKHTSEYSISDKNKIFPKLRTSKSHEGNLHKKYKCNLKKVASTESAIMKSQTHISGETVSNISYRRSDTTSKMVPINIRDFMRCFYPNTSTFLRPERRSPSVGKTQQNSFLCTFMAPPKTYEANKEKHLSAKHSWSTTDRTAKTKNDKQNYIQSYQHCTKMSDELKHSRATSGQKKQSHRRNGTERKQSVHRQESERDSSTDWHASFWDENYFEQSLGVYYVNDGCETHSKYTALRLGRDPPPSDDQSHPTVFPEEQCPSNSHTVDKHTGTSTFSQKRSFYVIICSSEEAISGKSTERECSSEEEEEEEEGEQDSYENPSGVYSATLCQPVQNADREAGCVVVSLRQCASSREKENSEAAGDGEQVTDDSPACCMRFFDPMPRGWTNIPDAVWVPTIKRWNRVLRPTN